MSSPMRPIGHSDWTENPFIEREQLLHFVDQLRELLVSAENDVLLLEVGGELHRSERVDARIADIVVPARAPGILAAADGAVADVNHVLDRTPDHALRACISAAANGHDAGDRFDVGLHAAVGLAFLIAANVLGAPLCCLIRVDFQDLVDEFLVSCLDVFNVFFEFQAHAASPSFHTFGFLVAQRSPKEAPAILRPWPVRPRRYAAASAASSAAVLPTMLSSTAFMMPCSISMSSSSSIVIGVGIVPWPTLAWTFFASVR